MRYISTLISYIIISISLDYLTLLDKIKSVRDIINNLRNKNR